MIKRLLLYITQPVIPLPTRPADTSQPAQQRIREDPSPSTMQNFFLTVAICLFLLPGPSTATNVGGPCDDNLICDSPQECDPFNVCLLPLGENCEGYEQGCVDTGFCENGVCKMQLEVDCTASPDHCLTGATCKEVDGVKSCVCDEGRVASKDLKECAGAPIAVVVSLPLMMASYLVTRII
ncbi:uncharacterized protein LOC143274881 [Babylonia areolata]|uniref:uncharacterized protein LOC143274881 n=1 Tax=Babylonia areolata TaxID=304850 RepID=UPI003FD51932